MEKVTDCQEMEMLSLSCSITYTARAVCFQWDRSSCKPYMNYSQSTTWMRFKMSDYTN